MHMTHSVKAICQNLIPGFRATATLAAALVLAAGFLAAVCSVRWLFAGHRRGSVCSESLVAVTPSRASRDSDPASGAGRPRRA